LGISLKHKLWDFKSNFYKIESAKIDKNIDKLNLKELKALLAYKLKTIYKLAIVQKEAIKIYKQNLKLKKEYYKQALSLYKQGVKTKIDSDRFLVNIYNAETELKNSIEDFKKTLKILSLYTGIKIDDIVNISFNQQIIDTKTILKNNYSIKIDELNVKKNLYLENSLQKSKYGNIDLVANYSKINTLNSYNSKSIGITFSIPLYTPKTDIEIQKLKIASLIQTSQKNSKILSLKQDIETLLNEIKKEDNIIDSKQKELKILEESKNLTFGRYKEGISTYLEVLDNNQALLNTNLQILEAKYKKSIAIDKLKYLKGEL
jgi:outer membrane protein TolC